MTEKKEATGQGNGEQADNVLKFETRKELEEKETEKEIEVEHQAIIEEFNAECDSMLETGPKEFKGLVIDKLKSLNEEMMESIDWNADQRKLLAGSVVERFQKVYESLDTAEKNFKVYGERIENLEQILFMIADIVMPHVTGKPIHRKGFAEMLNFALTQDHLDQLKDCQNIVEGGADKQAEA